MILFFKKPYRWARLFSFLLILSCAYVLLDTFVIPKAQSRVSIPEADPLSGAPSVSGAARETPGTQPEAAGEPAGAVITENSYQDEHIRITVETVRKYDTEIYVADIELSDASYLKATFAQGTFGRNIKETVSDIAAANGAIFAINGDYYGFRDNGFVVRNGVLYRSAPWDSGSGRALMAGMDGTLSALPETEETAAGLGELNAWQILSFGPVLVEDGSIAVSASDEVGKAMRSNPRTAIGQIAPLHYIVIVSDGRTQESEGLSLMELAEEFVSRGCSFAYNLDGGGSSTMVFMDRVVNNPANGKRSKERAVSDIVYISEE